MSQVILKKYADGELVAAQTEAGNNFALFAVNGANAAAIPLGQFSDVLQTAAKVYGYFNQAFPFSVFCNITLQDFPGTVLVEIKFNAMIHVDSSLVNMLALNAGKVQWTLDDLSSSISEDIKNSLSIWLLERVSEVPVANLKQYKGAAFIDDDGQKELAGLLPSWLVGQYKDCDIKFVGRNIVDVTGDDKWYELREWALKQGIAPAVVDNILESCTDLGEAKLKLERVIWTTGLAKKYKVDIEAIKNLVEKCCSQQEAENSIIEYVNGQGDISIRQKLASWICERTGITFAEAQKMIDCCPDIETAKIVAEEYVKAHEVAIELTKYGFSIIDAKKEIKNCGGPQQALQIWQTVEYMRNKSQKYKIMKQGEVAEYVKKAGPDRARFEVDKEGQKKKSGLIVIAVIVIVVAAAAVIAGSWLSSLQKNFSIKVASGNPVELEKIFNENFGNTFAYNTGTKTYSVKCTRSKKIAFLELMKSKGFQVEATDTPEEFVVVLPDNASCAYKINSSALADDSAALLAAQKYFGKKVYGGTDDVFIGQQETLYRARTELAAQGISVQIYGNNIILTPQLETLTIGFDAAVKAVVVNTLRSMSLRFSDNGNQISIAVKGKQKQQIIDALRSTPELGKTKINSDSAIYVFAKSWNNYSVRIFGKSKAEFDRIVEVLSGSGSIKVAGAGYKQNDFGVKIGTVNVSSLDNNATALKQNLITVIQNGAVSIRERDIKVSVK